MAAVVVTAGNSWGPVMELLLFCATSPNAEHRGLTGEQVRSCQGIIDGKPFDVRMASPIPGVLNTARQVLGLDVEETPLIEILHELTYQYGSQDEIVFDAIFQTIGNMTLATCYREGGMTALMRFGRNAWEKTRGIIEGCGAEYAIVFCESVLAQALAQAMIGTQHAFADQLVDLALKPGQGLSITFDGDTVSIEVLKEPALTV